MVAGLSEDVRIAIFACDVEPVDLTGGFAVDWISSPWRGIYQA